MNGGHVGKILRLDLTNRKSDTILTQKYEQWIGGFGMGLALFYDEVDKKYITDTKDKTGFEPQNVICLMSGPLQGTLAPNGGRTEVVGLAPEGYPRPQICRGNFGGKFSAMMKFAGYDGIVIKGVADKPVWVNIINQKVVFEDAGKLWGLDTYKTQEEIWREVSSKAYQEWLPTGTGRDSGSTTQRPAVVTMGQIGERKGRLASLVHEEGHAAGQGGFGGVFGAKGLKAVSVLGNGSVPIADPKELIAARLWYKNHSTNARPGSTFGNWGAEHFGRALNCYGCDRGCYANFDTGSEVLGAGSMCVDQYFNQQEDMDRNNGKITDATLVANTMMQRYGINAYELATGMSLKSSPHSKEVRGGVSWLHSLYKRGIIGKGKKVETDLDFSKVGTKEFAVELLRRIAYREEIGDDLAEGIVRAAAKWGVLESDLMSGLLPMIYAVGEVHWGAEVWWAYASLFQCRDINAHILFSILHGGKIGSTPRRPVAVRAKRLAELAPPWNDELMIDLSENGIYSVHMARLVAWASRYTKFYRDSAMMCCQNPMPKYFEDGTPDGKGISPEYETRFFNAVTGLNITYETGLEIGRKINNLERAILVLNGRHRDEEYFPPFAPYNSYVYTKEEPFLQNFKAGGNPPDTYTVFRDGVWMEDVTNFPLDKAKMDAFKTLYYELEGWNTATGVPTRKTLEQAGCKAVADELAARGKLPA